MSEEIKLKAFTIGSTTITTDEERYESAKCDRELDYEYDIELSNMGGETFIVEPDGTALWPYGTAPTGGIIELLEPVLDCVPAEVLQAYFAQRIEREAGQA